MVGPRWLVVCGAIAIAGCSQAVKHVPLDAGDATDDAGGDDGGGDDAGTGGMSCMPDQDDLFACGCDTDGQTRPCWPMGADPALRHRGACADGTQRCAPSGEFLIWGACTGATMPSQELCTGSKDEDCNGLVDCLDRACATATNCRTGCTNGQTRACYDGPPGTEGVGTCKGGTQVCTNGMWPKTCPGEVVPAAENCGDALDHNCNRLAGCLDLFACINDPKCQPQCKPTAPGCVCPVGSGELAMCPDGMHGIATSQSPFDPGTVQCCPCTASDCGDPECCGESVCKGNPKCGGFDCSKPLPAACNGMVGFDCDDYPEDCDVMCCKCVQGCP